MEDESESRTDHFANHNVFLKLIESRFIAQDVVEHQTVPEHLDPEKMRMA